MVKSTKNNKRKAWIRTWISLLTVFISFTGAHTHLSTPNPATGISELAVKRSQLCINIPMFGIIESLNLGTTSGIVLYEITKQRREYERKYKFKNKRGRKYIA